MLIVYLKETFINEFDPVTNTIAEEPDQESQTEIEEPISMDPAIKGKDSVYPFDKVTYTIENAENGS